MGESPDPAAVEAVAEAICDNEDGCGLWGVYWEEIEEGDRDNFRSYARHAIAALSALGWVEGQRHATVCDACETLTATYVAITRERDALRAALHAVVDQYEGNAAESLRDYQCLNCDFNEVQRDVMAMADIARDAIAAAKGTP